MKIFLRIAVITLAVLALIQLVPVTRSNPPVETEIAAPQNVRAILNRSCYDCHSNKTVWPWYSRVAPVSWLVSSDVSGGRQKMNFTTWNRYPADEQAKKVRAIWDQVERGEMPLWYYLLEHKSARLSEDDKAALHEWSRAEVFRLLVPPPIYGEMPQTRREESDPTGKAENRKTPASPQPPKRG